MDIAYTKEHIYLRKREENIIMLKGIIVGVLLTCLIYAPFNYFGLNIKNIGIL